MFPLPKIPGHHTTTGHMLRLTAVRSHNDKRQRITDDQSNSNYIIIYYY